jgi:hypothetical protein
MMIRIGLLKQFGAVLSIALHKLRGACDIRVRSPLKGGLRPLVDTYGTTK